MQRGNGVRRGEAAGCECVHASTRCAHTSHRTDGRRARTQQRCMRLYRALYTSLSHTHTHTLSLPPSFSLERARMHTRTHLQRGTKVVEVIERFEAIV